MDLYDKLAAFSAAGICSHPQRDLLLYGIGLHEHTWPIVEEVTTKWLAEPSLTHQRKVNWNLGMVVGAVVANQTRDDFDWPIVTGILGKATVKISIAMFRVFLIKYPMGLNKFSVIYDMQGFYNLDMKQLCRTLAKCAIFAEAVTFLESEGYGDLLKE